MDSSDRAEQALQLLFRKLHPHLEDAAHALSSKAPPEELLRLHRRLVRARHEVVEILEEGSVEEPSLAQVLDTLAANLPPLRENYSQSLTLPQLCLEEAPRELLPFVQEGRVAGSAWGKRMVAFLARLQEPAFQARERWKGVDPELGDELEEETFD
jgi:hypothetical protein